MFVSQMTLNRSLGRLIRSLWAGLQGLSRTASPSPLTCSNSSPASLDRYLLKHSVSLVLRCILGWGGEESVVQARSKDSGPWIRLSCCASCSGITISLFIDFFISSCDLTGLLRRDALLRLQRCRPSWTPLIRAPTWLVDIRCKTVPKSTSSTETDVGVIPDLWSFLLLLALKMTNRILFSIHNLCISLFRSCQFYESFCLKSIFSILTANMTSSTVVNWAKSFFR